ncbi:Proteasome subunit alpha type-1, partial [Schistosoma japonicum]
NQYDHDVSIWSPQGRIHQIEYAMEAVKQGSAAVALKNHDYAVIVALKRAPSELSSYQEKIIHIDDHVGVAVSGLTADGRVLSRLMRRECADSRWAYNEPLPISRLLSKIALNMQIPTQRYGRRPYGCPSSNAYDCKCIAIGSRSQSARTYLERHSDEFKGSSLDELICHGLKALNSTLPNEVSLNTKNCSLAIVGKDMNFTIFEEDDIDPYLKLFEAAQADAPAPAVPESGPTPMDQDQFAF